MFCPKCAQENSDRNKFCNGCGATLAVEIISPPPPPPPPTARFSSASAASKPVHNSSAETRTEKETDEKFFPADTAQKDKTEPLSDEKLDDEKNAPETAVLFSAPPVSPPPNDFERIIPANESPASKNSDNYFSEVKSKYDNAQTKTQTSRKNYLFIVGAASLGLIFLGGLAVVGWYFASREAAPQTVAENKTTADEKSKTNQTSSTPPPEMVYVAGGEFMMGSDSGDKTSVPPASPAHRVSVKPFFMDKTEVTCEEYKKFVDAAGYKSPFGWQNNNFPTGAAMKPVTGINWDDANAFAKWKNKRLPTEAEWEYAARGTDGRIYPWGSEWKPEMANADKQKTEIQEVAKSSGQSPFGVFDLSGNAWEWTASDAQSYSNDQPFEANNGDLKIIRGGFFGSAKERATTFFRGAWGARGEKSYSNTSFRCVRDVPAN